MAANIKEVPYVYRTLFGAPIDIRTVVESIDTLITELPIALRYERLIVYVKDKHTPYIFVNGINDSNFVPLFSLVPATKSGIATISKMVAQSGSRYYKDKIYIDSDKFTYNHNKGLCEEVYLSDYVTGERIDADISNFNNQIIIKSKLRGFFILTLLL